MSKPIPPLDLMPLIMVSNRQVAGVRAQAPVAEPLLAHLLRVVRRHRRGERDVDLRSDPFVHQAVATLQVERPRGVAVGEVEVEHLPVVRHRHVDLLRIVQAVVEVVA